MKLKQYTNLFHIIIISYMSNQSDFQKVVDFNTQFGVQLHHSPQLDIFDTEPKNVEFCLKLIREEVKELNEAVSEKDYIETIDALADIIYVVMGMGARIGTNMDYAFEHILINMNQSKAISDTWYEDNKNKLCYDLNDSYVRSMTNFQEVLKLCSGFIKTEKATFDHLENCDKLSDYVQYVEHGLQKLEDYVTKKNYVKTIKYLCMILYHSYNMSAYLGTDMDLAFDIVHKNNMSKLCATEDLAKETVAWYESQKEKLGYDSPKYRLAPDGKHWVAYNESTKKILKSISWKEVDLKVLYTN